MTNEESTKAALQAERLQAIGVRRKNASEICQNIEAQMNRILDRPALSMRDVQQLKELTAIYRSWASEASALHQVNDIMEKSV
jgi:hypothetical protein